MSQPSVPRCSRLFPLRLRASVVRSVPGRKAVALDLDGTLLDTLPDIAEAANRMLDDLGRPRADLDHGAQLHRRRHPAADQAPAHRTARRRARFRRCSSARCRCSSATTATRSPCTTRPFPGVLEGLERMRAAGLRLACVTNKADCFHRCPCWRPPGCAGYLELVVERRQPAQQEARSRCRCCTWREHFGVAPRALLVIGDSDNDSRGRAGGRLPGGLRALRLHRGQGCARAGLRCYSYRPRRGFLADPTRCSRERFCRPEG